MFIFEFHDFLFSCPDSSIVTMYSVPQQMTRQGPQFPFRMQGVQSAFQPLQLENNPLAAAAAHQSQQSLCDPSVNFVFIYHIPKGEYKNLVIEALRRHTFPSVYHQARTISIGRFYFLKKFFSPSLAIRFSKLRADPSLVEKDTLENILHFMGYLQKPFCARTF